MPMRYCGGSGRNAIYALKKGLLQPGLRAEFFSFNQGCDFQDHSCHIVLFQPILRNRHVPSELVKTAKTAPDLFQRG